MQEFFKLLNDNIIPLITKLNYSIILVPLLTLIWTIWNHTSNKYKPLIDQKDQKLLEHILLSNFEIFELKLYQPITTDNITEFKSRFNNLVSTIREKELFFYLGSSFTKNILDIEETINSTNSSKYDLKKLNKLYRSFSYHYNDMAWNTRKNLRIEKNYYFYKKNFNSLSLSDKINYYLSPKTFLSNFLAFGIIYIALIISVILIFKIKTTPESYQYLLSFYILIFCFFYMVFTIIIPVFIHLLLRGHNFLLKFDIYSRMITSIKSKIKKADTP
ncbi:hypothetical protein ACTGYW_00540 [Streptococcus suis]